MKRSFRLAKNNDIDRVRRNGRTYANKFVVIRVLSNQLKINRVAVIAGRSVGNAVQRNFAKRRIRSAYSKLQEKIVSGFDLVIIAKKQLLDTDFHLLRSSFTMLLDHAGLMKDKES